MAEVLHENLEQIKANDVLGRLEALDKGSFILVGVTTEQVLQAVDVAVGMNKDDALGIPAPDYVDENVLVKIVKLIQSNAGVVNKMVWRKY